MAEQNTGAKLDKFIPDSAWKKVLSAQEASGSFSDLPGWLVLHPQLGCSYSAWTHEVCMHSVMW